MLPTRWLIALSALTTCASIVQAQTAAPDRADVKAEARAAVKNGTTVNGERDDSPPPRRSASTRSRGQVKAEARRATRSGDTARGESTYKGPDTTANASSGKSRADVKNEAKATAKAGDDPGRGESSYGGPPKSASAARK